MFKQLALTEAERGAYLRDLRRVGSNKTVESLPLYAIRDFAHLSSNIIAARATASVFKAIEFSPWHYFGRLVGTGA